ncbi:MAG: hypothetical protein ABIX10_00815 [Acidimicrobiales bacterium]
MRRLPLLGAAACLALVTTACGGGDDDKSRADVKEELSRSLQAGGSGFDAAAAGCFADIVIDEVGLEEMRKVDLSADEPPEALQDDITAAAQRAADECDLASVDG